MIIEHRVAWKFFVLDTNSDSYILYRFKILSEAQAGALETPDRKRALPDDRGKYFSGSGPKSVTALRRSYG